MDKLAVVHWLRVHTPRWKICFWRDWLKQYEYKKWYGG